MRIKLAQVAGLVSAITAGAILGYGHTSEATTETVYKGVAPAVMPTIAPVPALRLPILLILDPALDAGWNIGQAVQDWNDATGCALFTVEADGQAHDMVFVHQTADVMFDGTERAGSYSPGGPLLLNPGYVDVEGVAAHELGHVLGLDHHDSRLGVMSGHFEANRSGVSATEAAQARQLQTSRCN